MNNKPRMEKPLLPLKHEFVASLDRFIHEAGMLADCVRTALDNDAISPRVADIVRKRLDAFDKMRGQP
jgi:hypothetical protein